MAEGFVGKTNGSVQSIVSVTNARMTRFNLDSVGPNPPDPDKPYIPILENQLGMKEFAGLVDQNVRDDIDWVLWEDYPVNTVPRANNNGGYPEPVRSEVIQRMDLGIFYVDITFWLSQTPEAPPYSYKGTIYPTEQDYLDAGFSNEDYLVYQNTDTTVFFVCDSYGLEFLEMDAPWTVFNEPLEAGVLSVLNGIILPTLLSVAELAELLEQEHDTIYKYAGNGEWFLDTAAGVDEQTIENLLPDMSGFLRGVMTEKLNDGDVFEDISTIDLTQLPTVVNRGIFYSSQSSMRDDGITSQHVIMRKNNKYFVLSDSGIGELLFVEPWVLFTLT